MTFDRIAWLRGTLADAREDGLSERSRDQLAVLAAIADDAGNVDYNEFCLAIGSEPSVLPWSFRIAEPA